MKLHTVILGLLFLNGMALAQDAPFADLVMNFSLSEDEISVGDTVTLNTTIENSETYSIVTNAALTIDLPPGSSNITSPDCTLNNQNAIVCPLPEFAPGDTANLAVIATINNEGHNLVTATLNGDNILGDFEQDTKLLIVESSTPDVSPVDLSVELFSNSTSIYIDGVTYLITTVKNLHQTNTALAPVVDMVLPAPYEFLSGDYCKALDQLVTCNVAALPAQSEVTFTVQLAGRALSPAATVTANVTSSQPDSLVDNNQSQLTGSIIVRPPLLCGSSDPNCVTGTNEEEPAAEETDETPDQFVDEEELTVQSPADSDLAQANNTADSSGGGTLSVPVIFLLLLRLIWSCTFLCSPTRTGNSN